MLLVLLPAWHQYRKRLGVKNLAANQSRPVSSCEVLALTAVPSCGTRLSLVLSHSPICNKMPVDVQATRFTAILRLLQFLS